MPDLERVRRLKEAAKSIGGEDGCGILWLCEIAEAAADILDITLPQPGASLLATGIQARGMFGMKETGCLTVSIEKLARLAEAFEKGADRG